MSIEAAHEPRSVAARRGRSPWQAARELIAGYPWVAGAIALLIVSALIVRWVGTRPGYDPYGWLVWGKLTVHLKLDTNGAPSWKPLPFLFTVPFAITGHYALWLWMTLAVAVSLSGAIFAWRIAWRLVDAPPERRYARYAAGIVAVAGVYGIQDYSHFILSAQSDTMIVSLCLGAIDCWLSGRLRWALWLWVLGGLGRPEVWPFLGAYALWAWRSHPHLRRQIGVGLLSIPVLWFGIPALTAKTAFVASSNALHSPRELHSSKISGTFDRFGALEPTVIHLAALLAVALAVLVRSWSGRRTVLMLAGGVAVWVLIEVAFAVHGFPAVPRYLFEAAGVEGVLAGVLIGRGLVEMPSVVARVAPRLSPAVPTWLTALVALAFAATLVPVAHSREVAERKDLKHEQLRTKEINRLSTVISKLGAARVFACGTPNVPIGYQSVFAWYTGAKIGELYVNPNVERLHPRPLVDFFALSNGWHVVPAHLTAASHARCAPLSLLYQSP